MQRFLRISNRFPISLSSPPHHQQRYLRFAICADLFLSDSAKSLESFCDSADSIFLFCLDSAFVLETLIAFL